MTYKPVDRSFSKEYLQRQHNAMRWLFAQGFEFREIQKFSLRNIDEDTREVVVFRKEFQARYFSGLGRVVLDNWDREVRAKVKGSGYEYWFFNQKFQSCYFFTREKPKSWRREIACNSLYSLVQIREICTSELPISKNVLTIRPEFGTMKITKLNITKLKAKELEEQLKV